MPISKSMSLFASSSKRRQPGLLSETVLCRHPLNCEPPLSMLMEKGFITPVSIHYVRNHGAVPKLDWDTHKVKVRLLSTLPAQCTPCCSAGLMGPGAAQSVRVYHKELSCLGHCCI